MKYPNFMRVVNTPNTKFVLWNTAPEKYQIEIFDRKNMDLISKVEYNTSYERIVEEFEFVSGSTDRMSTAA